eukprot:gene26127-biopygen14214
MNSCHNEGVCDRNRAGIRFQLDSGREHPPHDM